MNVEIGTETPKFLFWEYLFQNIGILSLQCMAGGAVLHEGLFSVFIKGIRFSSMTILYLLPFMVLILGRKVYSSPADFSTLATPDHDACSVLRGGDGKLALVPVHGFWPPLLHTSGVGHPEWWLIWEHDIHPLFLSPVEAFSSSSCEWEEAF